MRKGMVAALAAMGTLVSAPAVAQDGAAESAAAMWRLRGALNVAALACRGPEEAATVAAYNALLASEKAALADALATVGKGYEARYGAVWQARFDDDATRAYNHWAAPTAHDGFCAAAVAVLREATTVEPSDFAAFAAASLPRLEAAFAPTPDAPAAQVAATPANPTPVGAAVVLASAVAP